MRPTRLLIERRRSSTVKIIRELHIDDNLRWIILVADRHRWRPPTQLRE